MFAFTRECLIVTILVKLNIIPSANFGSGRSWFEPGEYQCEFIYFKVYLTSRGFCRLVGLGVEGSASEGI